MEENSQGTAPRTPPITIKIFKKSKKLSSRPETNLNVIETFSSSKVTKIDTSNIYVPIVSNSESKNSLESQIIPELITIPESQTSSLNIPDESSIFRPVLSPKVPALPIIPTSHAFDLKFRGIGDDGFPVIRTFSEPINNDKTGNTDAIVRPKTRGLIKGRVQNY